MMRSETLVFLVFISFAAFTLCSGGKDAESKFALFVFAIEQSFSVKFLNSPQCGEQTISPFPLSKNKTFIN